MKKNNLMPTVVLSAICIIAVAILALVNIFTKDVILANQEAKANAALLEVMPDGKDFEKVNTDRLPECVTAAHSSSTGGYVFQMEVVGYKTGLIIVCGVNPDGTVSGAKFIQSNETLGAENGLGDKYVGKTIESYTEIDSITGATLTSNGYKKAIGAALESFKILTGGAE